MKSVWNWLDRNSSQLQGLAAVVAILAGLAAVPFVVSKWLQPDMTIKVTAEPSSIPPALDDWVQEAARLLKGLPEPTKGDPDSFEDLRQLQAKGPLDPTRAENSWALREPSSLRIDVANHADKVISGVRLRIDRAYPSWGLGLSATFLTADEVVAWEKSIPLSAVGPTFVLPELPPLPPRSAITLVVYGRVVDADVSATVPDASFSVIPTVRLEDKGLVALFLRPYWLPLVFFLLALVVVLGLASFARFNSRRTQRIVTYDLACLEARADRRESALALLEEAIRAGYSNFEHIRRDPDLDGLRETEAFKRLTARS